LWEADTLVYKSIYALSQIIVENRYKNLFI